MEDRLVVHCGDCLEVLARIPDGAAQMCVTSPPYWGLRDYGISEWEGGDPACDHKGPPLASDKSTLAGYSSESVKIRTFSEPFMGVCGKCGARRVPGQFGLEPTPGEYLARMVAVFEQVRRVLKDDGTCWVNMGDCYAHSGACGGGSPLENPTDGRTKSHSPKGRKDDREAQRQTGGTMGPGLKAKDLVGMPWQLALAMRDAGWYLRQDIVWAKPAPMPESVQDRCTRSHEYIFLLSKESTYYYDQDAIRERTGSEPTWEDYKAGDGRRHFHENDLERGMMQHNPAFKAMTHPLGRNRRSVWTIGPQPYADAHFATFPEELPKLCIMAGCPAGGVVLDPFAGSGTVGKVALELGRRAILIEKNPKYVGLIYGRCNVTPGFAF